MVRACVGALYVWVAIALGLDLYSCTSSTASSHTRNAWKALAGLDAAAAMQQYVDRVAAWFPPPAADADADAKGGPGGEGGPNRALSDAAAGAGGDAGAGAGGDGGELSFGTGSVSTMGAIGLDGRWVGGWVGLACGLGGSAESSPYL